MLAVLFVVACYGDHRNFSNSERSHSLRVNDFGANCAMSSFLLCALTAIYRSFPQCPIIWVLYLRRAVLEGFVPTLSGPSPHIHFKATEGFFVVNGRAAFLRGDQTFVGHPGNLTFVPTNKLHTWLNLEEKPGDFRLLLITTPPTFDYILQLGAQGTDEYYVNSVTLDSGYAAGVVDSLLFTKFEYKLKQDGTPIVPVTVRRVGDTEEPASATIALSGGTAVLGEDYSTTDIPVNFGPQETTQTLEVPIPLIDNDLSEGNTTLELTLTNPTDGTIIAPLQSKALNCGRKCSTQG